MHWYEYIARKENKKLLWKRLFKLVNNAVFRKIMRNVRKDRDIKLVTTEARRNYLVSKPNCHTTKNFWGNLLAVKAKRIQKLMLHGYIKMLYYIKTEDNYADIAKDVEIRFDTSK